MRPVKAGHGATTKGETRGKRTRGPADDHSSEMPQPNGARAPFGGSERKLGSGIVSDRKVARAAHELTGPDISVPYPCRAALLSEDGMMKRLESIEDEMRGVVTYELPDGRYAQFDVRAVREYGIAKLLRAEGYEPPTGRVAVMQYGRRVGTVPADFEPMAIKSRSFLYDPRPGDFRREGDAWIVSRTLGAGDLDMVPEFQRDPSPVGQSSR